MRRKVFLVMSGPMPVVAYDNKLAAERNCERRNRAYEKKYGKPNAFWVRRALFVKS